jgi:hypothetical protein
VLKYLKKNMFIEGTGIQDSTGIRR